VKLFNRKNNSLHQRHAQAHALAQNAADYFRQLADDFRTAGLTHLTAVSGANVAIVLAVVLGLARRLRVPARVAPVVGLVALAGFVVLARPSPSVVRAAAMGTVVIVGMLGGRRGVSLAALGAAVVSTGATGVAPVFAEPSTGPILKPAINQPQPW